MVEVSEYTEGFRQQMVRRLTGPSACSQAALAQEPGVPQSTLSRWLRSAGRVPRMSETDNKGVVVPEVAARRPEDWSASERLAAVVKAAGMSEAELGTFLRAQGLHEANLKAWQAAALQGLDDRSASRENSPASKRVRELERELARKEKALAEAAALLVLAKKSRALLEGEGGSIRKKSGR
jgi:transposase-like protein